MTKEHIIPITNGVGSKTLDNGTYSLKVLYSNDKVVSATFAIDNIKNPQTYDEINTYYYLSMLSVVIICTSSVIKRKIKE